MGINTRNTHNTYENRAIARIETGSVQLISLKVSASFDIEIRFLAYSILLLAPVVNLLRHYFCLIILIATFYTFSIYLSSACASPLR